ncbi:hypothetical protein GCM10007079_29080 [Nocardiopsis terrae]|uniref:Uncharacterized protein n=1 Tax=Nocardiopsis terrae TaxID=372655 RepID=A0ABR9HEN8_9ACTN|nr:hypothetical protein [Nocardiopsis terrae]MBE1457491.1 hypothetical protein [Nocardiopsis terrae]GHC85859.1 hypothetical protein GCM10007079_29080 [Nocardiopsis terrae]
MRRSTREYETALLVDGEVLVVGGIVYRGRTMLDEEGAERFAPLERWAKGVAESLGHPVTWRARAKNEPEARGTARPGEVLQNRLAL